MSRLVVACKSALFGERIRRFLTSRGYAIELALDGIECLASLERTAPDALLLEWDLPWGGGAGATEPEVRSSPGKGPADWAASGDAISSEATTNHR